LRFAERAVADNKIVWRVGALALAQYRAGKYEAAIQSCADCLAMDPKWDPIWMNSLLASAHHRAGNVDAAKRALATASKSRQERLLAMMEGGVGFIPHVWWHILQAEMHFREARALLEGAVPAVDPRWNYLHGRSLATIGRAEEANHEFDAAAADADAQKDPLYVRLFSDLARQRIVAVDPHIYSPEKALALANHATKLAPNDGIAFSTLGLVEYRAARFAAALAALLRSQELLGEERLGTRGFLLAMTYWQMSSDNQDVDNRASQREQAQNWFRRAVEWTDRFDSGNIELRRLQAEAAKLLNPLPASDPPAKP
jgi:tetratricopeptide (TPR) repeat protein